MQIEVALLLILTAIIIACAIAIRDKTRTIFDPVYVASATFALLFFARPLYDFFSDSFNWVGIPVDHVMHQVMAAVAIAVVAFYIGNLLSIGPRVAHTIPAPPQDLRGSITILFAFGLLSGAIVLRLVAAELAGGFSTLFVRRENLPNEGTNIPLVSEAFLIVIPATLLFIHLIPRYRIAAGIGVLASLAVMLQTALVGNRRYLLVLGVAVVAYFILSRQVKPKLISMFAVVAIGFFAFIAPIELTRGQDRTYFEAVALGFTQPANVVEDLLLVSQSTSMVNAFALVVDEYGPDSPREYRYGASTLVETVLQPVPREIWPEKPEPIRTIMIEKHWGMERGGCVSLCPTFSSLATFYSDLGLVAVGLGSFLCGLLLRIPSAYYHRFPSNFIAQATMSIMALVPFFIWWAGLGSLVITFGTGVVPLLLVAAVAGTRAQDRAENRSAVRTGVQG